MVTPRWRVPRPARLPLRMKVIVGLGNPGREYEHTRHNVGWWLLDHLHRRWQFDGWKKDGDALTCTGLVGTKKVKLVKPQTYMNLSGDSVQPAAAFLKVAPANVVVVHDELDLPWKDVRLKVGGGHAGHNGLRSIIQRLGTPEFTRVRVGIGRPPPGFKGDVADFVLQDFDAMERAELPDVVDRAAAAVEKVVASGIAAAMNAVNTKK